MEANVVVLLHGLADAPAYSAFADLTRLAARPSAPRVIVGAALDNPEGAAFAALVKTAALEWSAEWKCLTIDRLLIRAINGSTDAYAAIGAELARGGADREVLLGPERAVRIRIPEANVRAHRTIGEGTWIVSGGARGITADCCVALAHAGARRIALLSVVKTTTMNRWSAVEAGRRRGGNQARAESIALEAAPTITGSRSAVKPAAILAQREMRARIAEIEAAGADVRYEPLDASRMTRMPSRHRGSPRMLGSDSRARARRRHRCRQAPGEKTLDQFSAVLRTKIGGARALLDACAGDPLEQICFFSSVAAHAGNAGQSDYAAANAALDRMALDEQARRGAACHVVSIAWGPWDGGMVTPSLARHFAGRGIGLIPPHAGARAFVD